MEGEAILGLVSQVSVHVSGKIRVMDSLELAVSSATLQY